MSIVTKVPNHQPRDGFQRMLELATGLVPFAFLALIVILSRWAVKAAAIILLVYTLAWLIRLLGYAWRLAASFYFLKLAMMIDWRRKLADIKHEAKTANAGDFWSMRAEKWYQRLLASGVPVAERLDPSEIYHALIVAVYNEPAAIIESTLKAIKASSYDTGKVILLVAYEARGPASTQASVKKLVEKYGGGFKLAKAIKHPDNIPGEAKAKAGNITYAGRFLSDYCRKHKIDPALVLVTTLDADNRPHQRYLAELAWTYCLAAKRTRRSYQPVPLFTNNIWDVPALVRVVATDSSFWFMMEALRPRRLRLFSAHAQALQTLEDTDYWNVEMIVEDGHQYWRTFFTYGGDHHAIPIWLPIYQDAVDSGKWPKTIIAQFRQLLRWAWGTADTPFIIRQALRDKNISWSNKLIHIIRQMDDYIAWSTAPIVLAIGGWLPWLLVPDFSETYLSFNLPYIISALQLIGVVGLIVPAIASLLSLPSRPKRYSRWKNLQMVLQWLLEPVALIGFVSMASLAAHFRLIINKPLEKFNVTEKVTKKTT